MWFDLSERAKFKLTGPDRVRYLNGQVTNQVDQDLSGKAILACICNLKGKVESLVSVTASAEGDALLIDAPAEQRETVFQRLDKYLIADDCELEDVTDDYQLFHHTEVNGEAGRVSHRFGIPGRDVWARVGEENGVPVDLIASAEAGERIRIQNGVPKWGKELTGEQFPAEVGLDRMAVDFHKGCYLGQEIVSRIESVGKVKRLLVGLIAVEPGLIGEEKERLEYGGNDYGEVTSRIESGDGVVALAFVKRSFTESVEQGILPEGVSVQTFES